MKIAKCWGLLFRVLPEMGFYKCGPTQPCTIGFVQLIQVLLMQVFPNTMSGSLGCLKLASHSLRLVLKNCCAELHQTLWWHWCDQREALAEQGSPGSPWRLA